MSRALITESFLTGIANAIRAKLGVQDTYTPPQMAAAIESIPTGGITPTGTKNITQNGTHDVTEYASANVNVPNSYAAGDEGKVVSNGALVAQTIRSVTANGTYDTTTNDEVVVSVAPNLQSKTVTENGTVTPDSGYDGLSDVTVNVEGGAELVGILKYGKTIFLSGTNKLVITASAAYQTFFVLGQKGVMGLITEMNGGNPQTNLTASSGITVSATAKSALNVKVSISGSNTSMNVYSAADFSVSSEA